MNALLTGFALFGYWLVVGYALTSRCLPRLQAIPNLLLAPAAGLAVTEIALYGCLRAGMSLGAAAIPVAAVLFLASLASLLVYRAPVPVRRYAHFAAILVAAYLLNGWPQVSLGYDWLGYASVDMSNYCAAASGFQERGLALEDGDFTELEGGRDYTQLFRTWYIRQFVRPGADMTLGALAALTGHSAVAVCMAFALAMHVALVSATGFLAYRFRRGRAVALVACLFMAVSSPSTFGILDQMLGQIGGLAELCGCIGLACRPAYRLPTSALLRRSALGGVLVGGLLMHYPEVLPFLGATFAAVYGLALLRGRFDRKRFAVAIASTVLGVALLGQFGVETIRFLVGQMAAGGGESGGELHSYHTVFTTPHGVLLFWGARGRIFPTIESPDPGGWWSWARIAVGAFALVVLPVAAALMARKRPAAAAVAVMAAVTALLFHQSAWFGVHKMVMYIQPFLAVALVAAAFAARRATFRFATVAFLVAVLGANAVTQFGYTRNTIVDAGRCPFPGVSRSGFVTELKTKVEALPAKRVLVSVESPYLSRFLVVPLRGKEASFSSRRDLLRLGHGRDGLGPDFGAYMTRPQLGWPAPPGVKERIESDPLWGLPPAWVANPGPDDYMLALGPRLAVLNRSRYAGEPRTNLLAKPLRDVQNHLVLRESRQSVHLLGLPPEPFDPGANLAFYGPIDDGVFPGRGRVMFLNHHLAFLVINPAPKLRLVMATAASPYESWDRQLPSVTITGASSVSFGHTGRGSARVVSPPFEPATEDGFRTLRIDLTRENWRPGPPQKFGVPVKQMVAMCRDLSLITEEEYARRQPPQAIGSFPAGVADPLLEYSGIDEEGWTAEVFTARLSRPAGAQSIEICGMIPQIEGPDFRTEATVLVDGAESARFELTPGEFQLHVPVAGAAGARWVECRFSKLQRLPAPDIRSVSAYLKCVGFVPANEALSRPPERVTSFPADLRNPRLAATGIHTDGWTGKGFKVQLTQTAGGQQAVIRGLVPDFAPAGASFKTEMTVLLDGVEVSRKSLGCGDFEVRVPAGGGAGGRTVECRFSNDQTLPAPDGRRASALLKFVGFEPARADQ